MDIIHPKRPEWPTPFFFVSRKAKTLCYCAYYRQFTAVTLQGSYPIACMDERIDFLSYATIFLTIDANTGKWKLPRKIATKLSLHPTVDVFVPLQWWLG